MGRLKVIDRGDFERIIVVGDIHGDYESFKRIRELFNPDRDLIVFLGDYADRGDMGIEVIEGIYELIEMYGDRIIALKGNHEDYRNGEPYFQPCTLIWEADLKRGGWINYYNSFLTKFFAKLFLAAIYRNILFVHGGISSKIGSIKDLENPSYEVEEDVLWSDPYEEEGEIPNYRGAGILFGPDISRRICKILNVDYIVRSHEPRKAFRGPFIEHEGRIVTISSTRIYGGIPFIIAIPSVETPRNGYELKNYVIKL
ncbi:MAG: metallophosphoesterase family protein [Candidatus Methanomethylicia archaeon]